MTLRWALLRKTRRGAPSGRAPMLLVAALYIVPGISIEPCADTPGSRMILAAAHSKRDQGCSRRRQKMRTQRPSPRSHQQVNLGPNGVEELRLERVVDRETVRLDRRRHAGRRFDGEPTAQAAAGETLAQQRPVSAATVSTQRRAQQSARPQYGVLVL